MPRFEDIVFMQGAEAHNAFRVAGEAVMAAGKGIQFDGFNTMLMGCAEWVTAMIDYLARWDCGESGEVRDTPSLGLGDDSAEQPGYLLSWNWGLTYVGLQRIIRTAGDDGPVLLHLCDMVPDQRSVRLPGSTTPPAPRCGTPQIHKGQCESDRSPRTAS